MNLKRIAVIGAGTMGRGIAQVLAQASREVLLYDADLCAREQGLASIASNTSGLDINAHPAVRPAPAPGREGRSGGELELAPGGALASRFAAVDASTGWASTMRWRSRARGARTPW